MAWLGKVSLGGFPDLAGAVTKLSESVKNIEKNFDSALGLEEKPDAGAEASGAWGAASERKGFFDLGAFMGHIGDGSAPEGSVKDESSAKEESSVKEESSIKEDEESSIKEDSPVKAESSVKDETSEHPSSDGHDRSANEQSPISAAETIAPVENEKENSESNGENVDRHKVHLSSNAPGELDEGKADSKSDHSQAGTIFSTARSIDLADSVLTLPEKADAEVGSVNVLQPGDSKLTSSDCVEQTESSAPSTSNELCHVKDSEGNRDRIEMEAEQIVDKVSPDQVDVLNNGQASVETEHSSVTPVDIPKRESADEQSADCIPNLISSEQDLEVATKSISHDTDASNELVEMGLQGKDLEPVEKKQTSITTVNVPGPADPSVEVEKVKKEMKMMEAALQGAARQAQAKADEIARLLNENEQLKSTIEDLKFGMETTSNLESEIGLEVDETEMDAETSLGDDDKGVELEEASMKGDSVATTELNSPSVTPNRSEGINLEPFVGMILESEVEAYQLYNEYSKQMGFGIRKKLCRRSKANNDIIAGWYVCSRQGAYARRGKTVNPRLITRVGCPAELKVKRMAVKKWQVIDFIKEHNHELDPENARLFRSHRRIQAPEQNLIEIVSRNLGVREQVNVVEKEQQRFLSAVDSHALHMHFMCMHSRNPAFSYAMDFNEKQHVRNAFWVDASSKVAYTHFGDVVMLDTMFLTNRFKMPLVSFAGVNHHGQSILLGCALLGDETPASYVWLFKAWLEAMSGQPPKALITDQSNSIATAVAEVFPETCHRFCLWLICKRVSEKLGYVWRVQTNFMKKFYKCIFDSLTEDEFEKQWWKFIQHFDLMNNEWLQGLYDDRQKWVLVYLKDTFFGGMSVSQRGESLNLFFDKHVNRHTSLKEFLEKYDLILESKCEDEAQEDSRSIHIMPEERMHPSPFELQLANVYTRSIFKKFQAEVLGISSVFASKIEEDEESIIFAVKAYEVQEDSKDKKVKEREYRVVWNAEAGRIYCICRLFEFKGYLCRHALVVFLASSVLEIPSHYILKRWTKDAKTVPVLNVGLNVTDDCSSSITQRFNDICVRCIKLAQEASLSKKGYDVALHALQEALKKVVYENNHPRRIIQNYNPRSSAYYKINEGSQANNIVTPMLYVPNQLGTMLVVCNPQAFQTATTSNKRIKYGAEKRASKQKKQKSGDNMQFSHSVATSAEVLHIPSGVNNMFT